MARKGLIDAPSNRIAVGGASIRVDRSNENQIVLGVVVDPERSRKLVEVVEPAVFADRAFSSIWSVFREQARRQVLLDMPSALRELSTDTDAYAALEGVISASADVTWESLQMERRVEGLMADEVRRRTLSGPIAALLKGVVNPRTPIEDLHAEALSLAEMLRGSSRDLVAGTAATRSWERDLASRSGTLRYGTGEPGFDEALGEGFAPRTTVLISAETGHGKSVSAVTLGRLLAKQGRRVLYMAWEEGEARVMDKIASAETSIPFTRVVRGDLAPEERSRIQAAVRDLADGPRPKIQFARNPFLRIWLEASGRLYQQDAIRRIRSIIVESAADVIIYDMWGRSVMEANLHATEKALEATQALHQDLGVCGVLIGQMNLDKARTFGGNSNAAVKGSKRVVEVADLALLLERSGDDHLDMWLTKQRVGVPALIRWKWEGEYQRISEPQVVRHQDDSDLLDAGGEAW